MPSTTYTQVYDPDGKWVGFFTSPEGAAAWVKLQDRDGYEITDRRPERKGTES